MIYTLESEIFPPSVNRIWRAFAQGGKVRNILTEDGRWFRKSMIEEIRMRSLLGQFPRDPILGPIDVVLDLYQPDHRRRDVDNYPKSVFDAVTHAGVWQDDSQVETMFVRKHPHGVHDDGFTLKIITR